MKRNGFRFKTKLHVLVNLLNIACFAQIFAQFLLPMHSETTGRLIFSTVDVH